MKALPAIFMFACITITGLAAPHETEYLLSCQLQRLAFEIEAIKQDIRDISLNTEATSQLPTDYQELSERTASIVTTIKSLEKKHPELFVACSHLIDELELQSHLNLTTANGAAITRLPHDAIDSIKGLLAMGKLLETFQGKITPLNDKYKELKDNQNGYQKALFTINIVSQTLLTFTVIAYLISTIIKGKTA